MKPVILTLVEYYLPGYKAGGPVRSIANLVTQLGDEFDFRIITRDRDSGETQPYPGIRPNEWNLVGKAHVYYASLERLSISKLGKLIRDTPHDILYLNSFFSYKFTIRPLILRKLGWIPRKPLLLAPRGEFSQGALELKRWKKWVFVQAAKTIGLYDGITWQASSEYEAADIRRVFFGARCFIAPNIPSLISAQSTSIIESFGERPLRIIFLSRITPKKNLDFALRVLSRVPVPAQFNIYGPINDEKYWQDCKSLFDKLPQHIEVRYHGAVDHSQVANLMADHDLFLFPTRGENYGHVIAEALAAGTPVLISDQTPWRDLSSHGVGWDLPLHSEEEFVKRIVQLYTTPKEAYVQMRSTAQRWAQKQLTDPRVVEANRQMFLSVLKHNLRN